MPRELLEGQFFTNSILFWVKLQNDMYYQDIYEFHDEFHFIFLSRATSRVRRSLFRSARTLFARTSRYLDSKLAMMKYAIQDFIQTLKRDATIQNLKSKVQDKMDNVACLQTRLEYYARESRKRKKYGYGGPK